MFITKDMLPQVNTKNMLPCIITKYMFPQINTKNLLQQTITKDMLPCIITKDMLPSNYLGFDNEAYETYQDMTIFPLPKFYIPVTQP